MDIQLNPGNISKNVNGKWIDRKTYSVTITFGGDFSKTKKANDCNAKEKAEELKRILGIIFTDSKKGAK